MERPSTSPMFQSIMLDMLHGLGWESRVGDPDIQEACWRKMFEEGPWRRRGGKWKSNKFLAKVTALKAARKEFSMRRFGYQHICQELGMLEGGAVRPPHPPEGDGGGGGGGMWTAPAHDR